MDYQKYNLSNEKLSDIYRSSKTKISFQHLMNNDETDDIWVKEIIENQEKEGKIYIGFMKDAPDYNINTYLFLDKEEFESLIEF